MKLHNIILSAAAVLLGLAACSKVDEGAAPEQKAQENLVPVTIGANFAGTKTTMAENGEIHWLAGDQITVKVGSNSYVFTLDSGAGTKTGTFSALVSETDAAIIAGTATDNVTACYPKGGASVPASQTWADGTFADETFPMTATLTAANTLTFTNPASIVMAKDVKVGTATSAELKYKVGDTDKSVTISDISGVTEADLLFVVEAGADYESFTLTLGDSSFALKCYTSANTEAGARYILNQYTCKIGDEQYKTLAEAVEAVPTTGDETTIQMIANETFAENTGVTIAKTQKVALDLNGKVIGNNITVEKASATVTNNGYLTIKDSSTDADGIITNGATEEATDDWWSDPQKNWATNTITNYGTLVLESGNIQNTATGISYCVDNSSNGVDATFEMKGGKMKDIGCAMRLFCNSKDYLNKVVISGGTIESLNSCGFWVQLPGSGGEAKQAYVEISGGTITGATYAFYDSSSGDVYTNVDYVISGGEFTGDIFSYGANTNISGGTFHDLVRIKQNTPSNISVSGGYFDDDLYCYSYNGAYSYDFSIISGGYFKTDDDNCGWILQIKDGYEKVANTDEATMAAYPWKVEQAKVAEVDGTQYTTLEAAFDAANEASTATITMLADYQLVEGNNGVEVQNGKSITLDLNGKTVKNLVNTDTHSRVIHVANGGSFTVNDSGTGGTITNVLKDGIHCGHWQDYNYVTGVIINEGTLFINGGTIKENYASANSTIGFAIDNNNNTGSAVTTINGGTVTNGRYAIRQFCQSATLDNSITVKGGTITGEKAAIWTQLTSDDASVNKKADVVISGGTLSGNTHGMLVESQGNNFGNVNVTISGGTFSGSAPVTICGGHLKVSGGTFSSGLRVSHYGRNEDGNEPASGVEFVRDYEVTGGTFNGSVYSFYTSTSTAETGDAAMKFLKGGTYSADPTTFVASGYEAVQSGDTWTVQ